MPHEPREKRDAGIAMCPNWVRSEIAKLCNDLNGEHDGVMVAAVALCGPNGFDCRVREHTLEMDPHQYGPVMLEALSIVAGHALARILSSLHASADHVAGGDDDEGRDIDALEARAKAFRRAYDVAVRQFIAAAMRYGGAEFQRQCKQQPYGERPEAFGMSVMSGSQIIGLWQGIAEKGFHYQDQEEAPPTDEDDTDTHEGQRDGPEHPGGA